MRKYERTLLDKIDDSWVGDVIAFLPAVCLAILLLSFLLGALDFLYTAGR